MKCSSKCIKVTFCDTVERERFFATLKDARDFIEAISCVDSVSCIDLEVMQGDDEEVTHE